MERNIQPNTMLITVFDLYNWYKQNKIDSSISDQQRSCAELSLEYKQELIDSILRGIPINPIVLMEQDNACMKVVDGTRRIRTIVQYIDDGFILDNEFFPQKIFSELPPLEQRRIQDYQINVVVVKKMDAEDTEILFRKFNSKV